MLSGDAVADVVRVRRRAHLLTIPSGVVLFVCLFLPAATSCDDPITPLELPPFWWPYVIGAIVAGFALHAISVAGPQRSALRRRAAAGVVGGLGSMAWLGFWCRESGLLVGLPLSLVGATGVTIGCLVWLRDLRVDDPLPVATLGRGRRDGPGFAFLVALHLVAALAVARYVPYTPPPKPPLPPMPPTAQMLCLGMCGC